MSAEKKATHPPPAVEDVPDPDEDDLDDLDEMLDEFSATKIDNKSSSTATASAAATAAPPPSHSGPGRPDEATGVPTSAEDDFAKEIQAGMADMLRELENNPEMASQFEAMLAQFGGAGAGSASTPVAKEESKARSTSEKTKTDPAPTAAKASDDKFHDTIRRTMERMKESSHTADAAAQHGGDDDMMANLLRELQEANGGADGEGDDTFSRMLMGMMEQLTNKEILYEPMKELDTKFPAWLEDKKSTLNEEDKIRYLKQRELVRDIVQRFERKGYSDGNADDREFIVEKMQEMQAAGAPPPDLVGDVNAASEMMNDLDSGCPQQ